MADSQVTPSAIGRICTISDIFVSELLFYGISGNRTLRIAPYIPPIDPSNPGDTQNFDETFLDMEPVVKDAEDGEEQTDTVHAQEADVDVFDGYSFKGRHSVVIDDENSDLGDEEDVSILKSPVSEGIKEQESAPADTGGQAAEAEAEEERQGDPRTPVEDVEDDVTPKKREQAGGIPEGRTFLRLVVVTKV